MVKRELQAVERFRQPESGARRTTGPGRAVFLSEKMPFRVEESRGVFLIASQQLFARRERKKDRKDFHKQEAHFSPALHFQ
jgi:hypothetical protein